MVHGLQMAAVHFPAVRSALRLGAGRAGRDQVQGRRQRVQSQVARLLHQLGLHGAHAAGADGRIPRHSSPRNRER